MLLALMRRKDLTATQQVLDEITAAANSHLGKLVDGQLLQFRRQGRH